MATAAGRDGDELWSAPAKSESGREVRHAWPGRPMRASCEMSNGWSWSCARVVTLTGRGKLPALAASELSMAVQSSRERILEMLECPRPVRELASVLGISNQAVHEHLKRLMSEGKVRAAHSKRGAVRVLYVCAGEAARQQTTITPSRFDSSCNRLIRAMKPDLLYSLAKIREITGSDAPAASLTLDKMVVDGHARSIQVSGRRLCALTSKGAAYGRSIGKEGEVAPDPLSSVLGERRASVFRTLSRTDELTLGEIRSRSRVLGESTEIQLSKTIKGLRDDGLVVPCKARRAGRHRLSATGEIVAAFFTRREAASE